MGQSNTVAFGHRIETIRTEARLLGFSYDFGVTVIRHKNAEAMVLASALMRDIHPLIIFKMADVQGDASHKHWLGHWRQHFDDESWRGSGYAFLARNSVCLYSVIWC